MNRCKAAVLTLSALWSVLGNAVLLNPCVSEAATPADTLRRDGRLRCEVTIRAAGAYVAEIADAISKQTGARVRADEGSGASDVRVLVWVSRIEE